MVRSLLWPRRAALRLRILTQTLGHHTGPNLLAVAPPQRHRVFISKLPAANDDFAILLGVQRIGHVLLLHGAVDNHFALLCPLSMHLG